MTISVLYFIDCGQFGIPGKGNVKIAANTAVLFTQSFEHWGVGRADECMNESRRLFWYLRKVAQPEVVTNEFKLCVDLVRTMGQVGVSHKEFRSTEGAILWLLSQNMTSVVSGHA